MKTYSVTVERAGDWWAVLVRMPRREVATQCRRLDQVETMAREAVSLSTDQDPDSFALDVDIVLRETVGSVIEATFKATADALQAQRVASEQSRRAVRQLRDQGFTVRDCAELLNLSPARVSQLLAG